MRMGQREGDDVAVMSRGLALKASLFQVQYEAAGGFQLGNISGPQNHTAL